MGRRPQRAEAGTPALILVDSSVWIDHFRGLQGLAHVQAVRRYVESGTPIVVLDLILMELLQGASSDAQAAQVEAALLAFRLEPSLDGRLAALAAGHYRRLRAVGRTVRKSVDLVIATACLDRDYALLHNDRDFEPMHELLGLRRASVSPA